MGAGVAEGRSSFIIFFWDRLAPHRTMCDVKALLRLAVVYKCRLRASRDRRFLLSSPLMDEEYERRLPDWMA